jgi:hypothetical protein
MPLPTTGQAFATFVAGLSASTPASTDTYPVVVAGVSKKATGAALAVFLAGSINTWLPATPVTAVTINAAYAAAAGGGMVLLPNGTTSLSATIVPVSGVKLRGSAPTLVYNTIPDSGLTTLVGSTGGTVLNPSGAFPAISWNTASLSAPASQTAFSQAALTNIAFEDIGFSGAGGGTWAILAGNTNNPSCWYSQFRNIYATGFTAVGGGGFSLTNYQHCQFNGNYTFGCTWGQFHGIDVASASLAPGNSTYYDLYSCIPTGTSAQLARGISFITTATTGGAGDNNQFMFNRVQSNRFSGATVTQAATMAAPIATVITSTSASIVATNTFAAGDAVGFSVTTGTSGGQVVAGTTYYVSATGLSTAAFQVSATVGGAVITFNASGTPNVLTAKFSITSGTSWAVGLPVTPSATLNGLTLNTVYFVTSLSGTTMTVSKSYGGAPIPMTAASAVNLINQGFPCFEMIALAGSQQSNVVMHNVDLEGLSTAAMVFQNVNGFQITMSQVPGTAQATQSMVCRTCTQGITISPQGMSTDWDNGTNASGMGFYGTRSGTSVGYMGYGQWLDAVSGNNVTSSGNVFNNQSTGDITFTTSNNGMNFSKNVGLANLISKTLTGASSSIANLNCAFVNNTSGSTTTMPALTAGNDGGMISIFNSSAGVQTYTTAGELINNIALRTSFTLAPGASIEFIIRNTQWIIRGGSSAMAAGAVSAPS